MKLMSPSKFKEKHRDGYGCLMLYLKINDLNWSQSVLSKIDKDDLYEVPGENYGLEKSPHITVLYGFHHDEISDSEIIASINDQIKKSFYVTLKGISLFKNDKFDVVKFDVEHNELTRLNNYFRENFKYTNSYKDYHAHATIAYVKPGKGTKYVDEEATLKLKAYRVVYSKPGRESIEINLM